MLRGLARTDASPEQFLDWFGRLVALTQVHTAAAGGVVHPTALDLVLCSFPTAAAAHEATFALWDEIESTREGHRHGGLLGVGMATHGSAPTGTLHAAVARCWRLALLAEEVGEVLVDDRVMERGLPVGFGGHRARASRRERVGFSFHQVADYR